MNDSNTVSFAEDTQNIHVPAYAQDFQKAIKELKASGHQVNKILGNQIFSVRPGGLEFVATPEMTLFGIHFVNKEVVKPVVEKA